MQENNNFETIISTWRRLSGEQIESAVVSMSGDSSEHQPHRKKEEETDLLPKPTLPTVTTTGTTVAAVTEPPADSGESNRDEEKKGFIQYDKEESKEAAGDSNDKAFKNDKNDDYLENDKEKVRKPNKSEKDKLGDNVDSVYLRPPPPHKTRSNTSNVEQEDCGITCLYYTLQCCDCVLM